MDRFIAAKAPFRKDWTVRRSGAKRALKAGLTRFNAWREARRLARGSGGQAYLMGRDGRVETRNVYGKDV